MRKVFLATASAVILVVGWLFAARRILPTMSAVMLLAGSPSQASTVQVNSIASNDSFDWGQVRVVDGSGIAQGVPSPLTVTSDLGRTALLTDGVAFTGLIEGPDSDWTGNFLVGDNVLITADNANLFPIDPSTGQPTLNPAAVASSFQVDLANAVAGLGLQISSNRFGNFSAELRVFDSANVLLGVFNVDGRLDGAEDGSAPFLGALSDDDLIARAIFTVVSVLDDGELGHPQGVGVNRLVTIDGNRDAATPVPEPATIGLVAIGAASAILRRRRADKYAAKSASMRL
jgi:hypothetical protein